MGAQRNYSQRRKRWHLHRVQLPRWCALRGQPHSHTAVSIATRSANHLSIIDLRPRSSDSSLSDVIRVLDASRQLPKIPLCWPD